MPSQDKLSPEAWTDAAIDALARGGPGAVKVEPLARALKVTKGSFYWHFADRDALLAAAAARWEALSTDAVIAQARTVEEPRARLTALLGAAHSSGKALRVARALAGFVAHPVIGPAVRRVAARRMAFIEECYAALGLDAGAAGRAARLAYAAYLGLGELDALGLGLKTPDERAAYLRDLVAALVPRKKRSGDGV